MTNKEIADELREHAVYSEEALFSALGHQAWSRTCTPDRPSEFDILDPERRMYMLFLAESLS